jgi:hypothetical protein
MRSFLVVLAQPGVEVALQLFETATDFALKGDPLELVEHGLVKTLDDAVGLWALHLGAGVIDVLYRQVELVLVALGSAAVFAAAVGQNPVEQHAMIIEERHHPVVEQVRGHQRGLAVIEFRERHLGIGVEKVCW